MPVSSAPRVAAACGSDPGRERENNEDRVLFEPDRGIFAVIDGVGGESAGEVAAQTARDVLRARLSRRTTDLGQLVREGIALANKQIYDQARRDERLAGMSCVLTVAMLDGGHVTVGHVGDSRLYALRPGEIRKITRDHSPVGAREDAGEIPEIEAMRHPRRNEIFRDVGSAPHEPDEEGFIDVEQFPFDPESGFLICSDGLSDLVTSGRILELVEAYADDPQAAVDELIAEANAEGGKDNISVVLVLGDRFARSVRRRPAAPIPSPTARSLDETTDRPAPMRSQSPWKAAQARRSPGERLGDALRSPWMFLLVLIAAAAAGWVFYREPLLRLASRFGLGEPAVEGTVLRVGLGDGGFATIGAALAQARPGQTIEVAPGEYREAVHLKDGVSLVSPTPRAAVIRPPAGSGPAMAAQGVQDARVSGFRIEGGANAPLAVGLRLVDSDVEIERVEISGAATMGVEIAGRDRSTIRYSSIRENPGGGVFVADEAAPMLIQNLIVQNGTATGNPKPGIEIRDTARPSLIQNRIEGNGGPGILLATDANAEEYFLFNTFGGLPREQAIQTPATARPPVTPTTPPTRSRGSR
ncbi:MAG TPA: protein phosphatase 2C domain-containing protein [Thermoanaerobaculia bacterium]|nr:protein phosphatase 2C domain-containing protein [Thermoanaerobaculia bacterium]